MTTLTEKRGAGAFLAAEANGTISRENVIVEDGAGEVLAGTVMGQITANSKLVPWDPAAGDGSEVAYGILYGTVTATGADAEGAAVVRHAELNESEVIFANGDAGQIAAAKVTLLAKDIKFLSN
jgi:hypothetical protein